VKLLFYYLNVCDDQRFTRTDRQMDGQTDDIPQEQCALRSIARKKFETREYDVTQLLASASS